MAANRLTLAERFSRGDDSVLNRNSSAERRLAEVLGILTAAEVTRQTLFKNYDLDVDLGAILTLPAQVISANVSALVPGGGVLSRLAGATGVGQLLEGDILGAAAASSPLGLIKAAEAIGGGVANVNPAVGPDGTLKTDLKGIKIDVYSLVVIAVMTGYVLEKGAGLAGAVGANIGAAISAADAVVD